MTNTSRLEGKNALVTGANSGIGLAIAVRLAAEGAHVFITGRRQDQLDQAARQIGDRATPVQGDITSERDLHRLFETIRARVKHLDVVVANAGGGTFVPLGSYTTEHIDETFDLNVKGTAFTVQGALPMMPDGGSIVLIGSLGSVQGTPALGVYAAAKAAIRSFARTWAVDLKARGIRVNVVSPGVVPTPAYDALGLTPDAFEPVLPRIPLGRLGKTSEIAAAVAFFASSDSSYVTGSELFVDGGYTQV